MMRATDLKVTSFQYLLFEYKSCVASAGMANQNQMYPWEEKRINIHCVKYREACEAGHRLTDEHKALLESYFIITGMP
jgi:hypothetical protein